MGITAGARLRLDLAEKGMIPFIGIYDAFSASVAARYFDGIFISGFGFAASFYGMPDIGLISWSDIVSFAQRVRIVLPKQHIMVDIDDGYADDEIACHVVALLETIGASGVILEDQRRPKRCGHLDGKLILELDNYLERLEKVLATRKDLVVVARTDASAPDEIIRRVRAFNESGADWILVDGIVDLDMVGELKAHTAKPLVFNQITGGKAPSCSLSTMKNAGIAVPLYSTPCIFAGQASMQDALRHLVEHDGILPPVGPSQVGLGQCMALLRENHGKLHKKYE
jgi:2-methylisocitrate lyase-like PEP mutase family enzyme